MGYIRIPIEKSPDELAQTIFDYITSQAPNWQPQTGQLDVWIARAVAQLASELTSLASDVQDDIFRWFGASLMGIQPLDAISATVASTWALSDNTGHTITAGTSVSIPDSAGNLQGFQVDADIVVPNGQSATTSGQVLLRAIVPGSAATGIGGNSVVVQLNDILDWVTSVTLTGATAGGQDAESDPDYLARLSDTLRRLSQRPILPADFAAMAVTADSTVARAVAIDGYNPGDSTYNNERMITVSAAKADGTDVSAPVAVKIQALLDSNREVNFIVNYMNPNRTTINVNATIVVQSGFDASSVYAAAESAVTSYLNPANWGQDPSVRESTTATTWVETGTLYYNNLIAVISDVDGVDHVTAMTVNSGTSDISLNGPASLTTIGTISVHG